MTSITDGLASLFSLPVEDQTVVTDIKTVIDNGSVFFTGSSGRWFKVSAIPGTSVLEYIVCDTRLVKHLPTAASLVIPRITLTTFSTLCESSYANTLKTGGSSNDFASRLKTRLESLVRPT